MIDDALDTPGDSLEGAGQVLKQGRLVAPVHYHLTIPIQTYFFINPTGHLSADYQTHIGGFILVEPTNAEQLTLQETYTLELSDRQRRQILVERRYKQVQHQGRPHISFWVKIISRPQQFQI